MTDLYRFYDENNRLLYVGISLNAAMRASQHKADKPWWPDVARMELERVEGSRADAERVEAEAIRRERPVHNIKHAGQCAKPASTLAGPAPLVWACSVCGNSIADGDGYLTVSARQRRAYLAARKAEEADRVDDWTPINISVLMETEHLAPKWTALHRACDPDIDDAGYWFDVERIRTVADVLDWTAHLLGKDWIQDTDWRNVLYGIKKQWGGR